MNKWEAEARVQLQHTSIYGIDTDTGACTGTWRVKLSRKWIRPPRLHMQMYLAKGPTFKRRGPPDCATEKMQIPKAKGEEEERAKDRSRKKGIGHSSQEPTESRAPWARCSLARHWAKLPRPSCHHSTSLMQATGQRSCQKTEREKKRSHEPNVELCEAAGMFMQQTQQLSQRAALLKVPAQWAGCAVVAVHHGQRPLITDIGRCIRAVICKQKTREKNGQKKQKQKQKQAVVVCSCPLERIRAAHGSN